YFIIFLCFQICQLTIPVHCDLAFFDGVYIILNYAYLFFFVNVCVVLGAEPILSIIIQYIYGTITVYREKNRFFFLISCHIHCFSSKCVQVIHLLLSCKIIELNGLSIFNSRYYISDIYLAIIGSRYSNRYVLCIIIDI